MDLTGEHIIEIVGLILAVLFGGGWVRSHAHTRRLGRELTEARSVPPTAIDERLAKLGEQIDRLTKLVAQLVAQPPDPPPAT